MTVLDFLKTFGINTATNFDLKDYANYLGLSIKVLMNGELYKIEKTKKHNIIINIQNSNKKGSHWVCFKVEPSSKANGCHRKYYFDSYGIKPTKEVEYFLNDNYVYNHLQVQPDNTKICGVLCLYVLYMLNNNVEFENIIQDIYKSLKYLL